MSHVVLGRVVPHHTAHCAREPKHHIQLLENSERKNKKKRKTEKKRERTFNP